MRAAPLPRELSVRAGLFWQDVRTRRRGLLRGVALRPLRLPINECGTSTRSCPGLLLSSAHLRALESAVLPKHPSLQICFHAAQTVALLRKITYDRDFGQGKLQAPARLAALLGDVALFDVGLFKPTCVASFGFARQLLLQLGVVVVGAFVVFAPICARILAQLKKDSTYRSFARVRVDHRLLQGRLWPGGL